MAQEKRNPLLYLFSKTWHYSLGNRDRVVLYWTLFIAGNSIPLFGQPFVWKAIMDTIQLEGVTKESMTTLLLLLALSLGIDIAFWSFHGPARILENLNAFKARANYRSFLLKGVMTLPLEWHTEHHSGRIIDKIEKGTTGLYEFSKNSFEVIRGIVELIGSFIVLTYFSPPAGVIVVVMVCVTMWITIRFDRVLVGQYREINHMENAVSESVFDAISNVSTVIILRVERLVFEAIMTKVMAPLALSKQNDVLNECKWFLTSMCCAVMTVAVLGTYFFEHFGSAEGVLVGSVYLLIQYLSRVSELFYKFTSMYGDVVKRRARVANAEELAGDFRSENFTNHVLPEEWRALSIEHLCFSYHGDGKDRHLKDVSLSIARGERIALVGETGSGKTTLLKVMRDLYHPQKLTLSVDGAEIPYGFSGISRAITLVPQDPEIFATTILENITLGAEHDSALIEKSIRTACFADVVDRLPHGLHSSTKEKGVNLSGGQQQRLALSRGLLACHDKDIVLLDEPTSSLDTETEMQVYRNIFREFRGKTIISSVHRLHLLPLFDRICVFEDGKITASGTFTEMLASSPKLAALWKTAQETITSNART